MNYCTLFNSAYLTRGLALYASLEKCSSDFHLYIFAFDEPTYQILSALKLPHATVIPLSEFETPELLAVKPTRTTGEYCWTSTPATILYCLQKYQLDSICYLDADLYFWQDPNVLLEEVIDHSILITEHRYTKAYDNTALSGKYCVQFMYFKNDSKGVKAATWWRDACLDWCYDRVEGGKFGDQKYLDDWCERFDGVKVLDHIGGGVAPWNVQQYALLEQGARPRLEERATGNTFSLVFYHFHALKFINKHVDFGNFKLSKAIIKTLYFQYLAELLKIEKALKAKPEIKEILSSLNVQGCIWRDKDWLEPLREIKKRCLGTYNRISLSDTNWLLDR